MFNLKEYKSYFATVEVDLEDQSFYGKVAFINDLVTFAGTTLPELQASFEEAVDDYLIICEEYGDEPNKSFSGRFNLRMPKDLHQDLSVEALKAGVSLNKHIIQRLEGVNTSPEIIHKVDYHQHAYLAPIADEDNEEEPSFSAFIGISPTLGLVQ